MKKKDQHFDVLEQEDESRKSLIKFCFLWFSHPVQCLPGIRWSWHHLPWTELLPLHFQYWSWLLKVDMHPGAYSCGLLLSCTGDVVSTFETSFSMNISNINKTSVDVEFNWCSINAWKHVKDNHESMSIGEISIGNTFQYLLTHRGCVYVME